MKLRTNLMNSMIRSNKGSIPRLFSIRPIKFYSNDDKKTRNEENNGRKDYRNEGKSISITRDSSERLTLENHKSRRDIFEIEKNHSKLLTRRRRRRRSDVDDENLEVSDYDGNDLIVYPRFIPKRSTQVKLLKFLLYQLDLKLRNNRSFKTLKGPKPFNNNNKNKNNRKEEEEEEEEGQDDDDLEGVFSKEDDYRFEEGHFDKVITNYREIPITDEQLKNSRIIKRFEGSIVKGKLEGDDDEEESIEGVLERLNEIFYETLSSSKYYEDLKLNKGSDDGRKFKEGEEDEKVESYEEEGGGGYDRLKKVLGEPLKHILHLSSDGRIGSHLDNFDSSGSIIIGLSLGGSRVLRLKFPKKVGDDDDDDDLEDSDVKVFLPSGSLYIQKDSIRYGLEHSIESEDKFNNKEIFGSQRIGLILRDRKFKKNKKSIN